MNLNKLQNFRFLSANALKIIAAVLMVIDHIGYMIFPDVEVLRIIGRLCFPIFAFFIAEGCRYTKNKWKYFALIFSFGVIFYIVYLLFADISYPSIFITFSLSILLIYCLQNIKQNIFSESKKVFDIILSIILFLCVAAAAYFLCETYNVDYGFMGVLTPVAVSICDFRSYTTPQFFQKIDNHLTKLICLAIILILYPIITKMTIQWYALLALVPLLFYSGSRGKHNMKYFFYIFYPLHMVIIYLISLL